MVKANKYFILSVFFVLIFGITIFLTLQKFFPLFFEHTVYYCQSLVRSFSMRIPKTFGFIFAGTLFILVAISIFRFILSYLRVFFLRRKFALNIKTNRKFTLLLNELGLENKGFLVKSNVPFAFCLGIRNPKIYISTNLVDKVNGRELKAILLHERHHLEKRDSLTLLFTSVVENIFPFFPILGDTLKSFRIESELRADEFAIAYLGTKKPLISVLKKLLRGSTNDIPNFAAAIIGQESLDIRVKKLIGVKYSFRKFKLRNVLISLGFLFLLFGLIAAPTRAVNDQTNVESVCRQGNVILYTPANFSPIDK